MLLQLPQLFGSIDVLHKAAGLTKNQDCLAAIDRLLKLYDYLKIIGYDKYISFDLGALSNHGYYTGIILQDILLVSANRLSTADDMTN